MQTFLPSPHFHVSASVLDDRRLGKQRVECLQILNALERLRQPTRPSKTGWLRHPAVLMWVGHEACLRRYLRACILEWISRGFKNTMKIPPLESLDPSDVPAWLSDDRLHASHRSNLLRKNPVHYGKFGWTEPNDLPYYWPIQTRTPENSHGAEPPLPADRVPA